MNEVHSFQSMGCSITVAGAGDRALASIRRLFDDRDRRFSRFRPDSELCRVNRLAGRATPVSDEFAAMVELSLWASRETGGTVDPTLGGALAGAGYDRDFEALADDPRPPLPGRPGCWRDVHLRGRMLWMPPGTLLDLNGVVKSATADDALELIDAPGWVSAGGDVVARGGVDVALPGGDAIRLVDGALATSGTRRRRWTRAGVEQHHLVDAATGRPAYTCWEQVTVSGSTCLAADVAAKAALLLAVDGPGWLEARGLPGRFVDVDGCVRETQRWASAARPPAVCT